MNPGCEEEASIEEQTETDAEENANHLSAGEDESDNDEESEGSNDGQQLQQNAEMSNDVGSNLRTNEELCGPRMSTNTVGERVIKRKKPKRTFLSTTRQMNYKRKSTKQSLRKSPVGGSAEGNSLEEFADTVMRNGSAMAHEKHTISRVHDVNVGNGLPCYHCGEGPNCPNSFFSEYSSCFKQTSIMDGIGICLHATSDIPANTWICGPCKGEAYNCSVSSKTRSESLEDSVFIRRYATDTLFQCVFNRNISDQTLHAGYYVNHTCQPDCVNCKLFVWRINGHWRFGWKTTRLYSLGSLLRYLLTPL